MHNSNSRFEFSRLGKKNEKKIRGEEGKREKRKGKKKDFNELIEISIPTLFFLEVKAMKRARAPNFRISKA